MVVAINEKGRKIHHSALFVKKMPQFDRCDMWHRLLQGLHQSLTQTDIYSIA
jgi:hypothetical protein